MTVQKMLKTKKDPIERQLNEVCFADGDVTGLQRDYISSLEKIQEQVEKKIVVKREKCDVLGAAYSYLHEDRRAERVFDCGTFLEYRAYKGLEKPRLVHANFCKDRLCPLCNWRRSRRIFSKLSRVMDLLEAEKYRFLFLTLTVRNCLTEDLQDTLQLMAIGWNKIRRDKRFKGSVAGVFKTLEVTRNVGENTYHPHFHCVLAVKSTYFGRGYISHEKWIQMWKDACSLNYDPVVDIRSCYVQDENGQRQVSDMKSLKAGLEASKYAVKDIDYLDDSDLSKTAENVQALMRALRGKRLCEYSGVFRDAVQKLSISFEDKNLTDDDVIRDDLEYMTVCYSWNCGVYLRRIVFCSQD